MFDVGFSELVLIAIVALFVIGPDRLPKVARTAGLWVGKMRGFVTSVKADIDNELATDELKRILRDQADSAGIHEIIEETKSVADDIKEQDFVMRAIVDDVPDEESDLELDSDKDKQATEKKPAKIEKNSGNERDE